MKREDIVKEACVNPNSEETRCVSFDTVFDLFGTDKEYMSSLENVYSGILKDTNINLIDPTFDIFLLFFSHISEIRNSYNINIVNNCADVKLKNNLFYAVFSQTYPILYSVYIINNIKMIGQYMKECPIDDNYLTILNDDLNIAYAHNFPYKDLASELMSNFNIEPYNEQELADALMMPTRIEDIDF